MKPDFTELSRLTQVWALASELYITVENAATKLTVIKVITCHRCHQCYRGTIALVAEVVDNLAGEMRKRKQTRKRPALILFFAFFFFYVSLSPFSISGMGYESENILTCAELFKVLKHLLGLGPPSVYFPIPRHGMFEVLLQFPLYLVTRLLGGGDLAVDRVLSLEPVIATSIICVILFLWVQKLTGSVRWAWVLAIAAGLATMLWPYAYIGLETSQSLFLLLAAYLVLAPQNRSRRRTILFVVSACLAVSLKTVGVLLLPAVAFLGAVYIRRIEPAHRWRWFGFFIGLLLLSSVACNLLAESSAQYLGSGGRMGLARSLVVPATSAPFNLVSMLASPNKGLLIYCPILLIALYDVRRAYRAERPLTRFALLVLGFVAAGFSFTLFWSDDVWGARYLHSAIGPLILLIAAARAGSDFRWRRQLGICLLTLLGFGISFLGAFFSYHDVHYAGMKSESLTIEKLQYSPEWNPIRFNMQLTRIWIRSSLLSDRKPQTWPPPSHPWSVEPEVPDRVTPVEINEYAVPQPFLFQTWPGWTPRPELFIWLASAICLISGLALFWRSHYLCFSVEASPNLDTSLEGDCESGEESKSRLPLGAGTDT